VVSVLAVFDELLALQEARVVRVLQRVRESSGYLIEHVGWGRSLALQQGLQLRAQAGK
jgi:hypothetical protein